MTKQTTENQLEEVAEDASKLAEDASKVAERADEVSDKAHAAAERVRNAPDSEESRSEEPATYPDYLNTERGSGSSLPGDDPITRPDY